jgi:hypothetical protein
VEALAELPLIFDHQQTSHVTPLIGLIVAMRAGGSP